MGIVCSMMREKNPEHNSSYQGNIINPPGPSQKIQKIKDLKEIIKSRQGQIIIDGQIYQLDLGEEEEQEVPIKQAQVEEVKKGVRFVQPTQSSRPNLTIESLESERNKEKQEGEFIEKDNSFEENKVSYEKISGSTLSKQTALLGPYHKKPTGRSSCDKNKKTNQVKLHFAYLYASPLVINVEQPVEDILGEISFKEEFRAIVDTLKQDQSLIRYRYQLATIKNFRECLRQEPIGIHFSGHGLQNTKAVIKTFAGNIHYQKDHEKLGDILVFEDQNSGSSHFLYEKELIALLALHNKKELKFVVVASCHSQRSGEIFKKAGAKHVICVDKDFQLNDAAAIVLLTQDNIDMKKLLEEKIYCSLCQEQKAGLDLDFQQGTLVSTIKQPSLLILPSVVTPWLPRDLDCYLTIEKLIFESARIVEVFGMPGVGKSALIAKVANYIADRNLYPGGIVYLNCSGISKVRELLSLFIQKVEFYLDNTFKRMQSLKGVKSKDIFNKLFSLTRSTEKMLFIFDNLDEVVIKEEKKVINTFKMFVNEQQNLQILFSTSKYIGGLGPFVVKNLKSLSVKKARDLFILRIPSKEAREQFFSCDTLEKLHEITLKDENMNLLNKRGIQIGSKMIDALFKQKHCKKNQCTSKNHRPPEDCVKAYFEKHPLFMIINEPFSICLAASQLHSSSIIEIYTKLISHNQLKDKDDALVISIESVFERLNQKCDFASDMLILIGLSPQGLSEDDLKELFKQTDDTQQQKIMELIELMEETSLISLDEENKTYKAQNTIHNFIESRIKDNIEAKNNYYRILAARYNDIIIQIKKKVHDNDMEIEDLIQTVERYDKNIVSCLNFLIDQKFQNQKSELNSPLSGVGAFSQKKLVDSEMLYKQLTSQLAKQITKKFDSRNSNSAKKKGFARKKLESSAQVELVSLVIDKTLNRIQTMNFRKFESDIQTQDLENDCDVSTQIARITNEGNILNDEEVQKKKQALVFNDEIQISRRDGAGMPMLQVSDLDGKFKKIMKKTILQEIEKHHEQDQLDSVLSPQHNGNDSFSSSNGVQDLNRSRDADSIVRNVFGNSFNNFKKRYHHKIESDDSVSSRQLDNSADEIKGKKYDLLVNMIANGLQKKLQKLSDNVTNQEIETYEKKLQKFSFFDKFINQKQSKAVQNFRDQKPDRGLTRKLSKLNGSGKKQEQDILALGQQMAENNTLAISSTPKGVNRKPTNSLQINTKMSKKRQTTMNMNNDEAQQDDFDLTLLQVKQDRKQSMKIPQQSFGKKQKQQEQLLDSEQVSSDEDSDFEKSSDEEDHLSEAYYLLYQYLSVQALKCDEKTDFFHLTDKFRVQEMDPVFRSNIDMLLVYQYFRLNRSGLIVPELENIRKVFQATKCEQGEAIASLFLGYFYTNLKVRLTNNDTLKKAIRYTYKSFILFQNSKDKQGLIWCNKLKKQIDHKMNTIMKEKVETDRLITMTSAGSRQETSTNLGLHNFTFYLDQINSNVDKIYEIGSYQKKRLTLLKDDEIFNFLINDVDLSMKN